MNVLLLALFGLAATSIQVVHGTCTENQANCAASTPNTCATKLILDSAKCAVPSSATFNHGSTTCTTVSSSIEKTICTSVTANGFWLDGEVVKANDFDTDGDGIPDIVEKGCNVKNRYCVEGRTADQIATADSDGDGIPDFLDLDR